MNWNLLKRIIFEDNILNMGMFSTKNKQLFPKEDADEIAKCIQSAEKDTSGEIRIYIESHCTYVNAMDRAWEIFLKLKMEKTLLRNAVLIYIAKVDKQVAIIGDEGIHEKVKGIDIWGQSLQVLKMHFKNGAFKEGLRSVVENVGQELKKHFPATSSVNHNEIPDEIVFGN